MSNSMLVPGAPRLSLRSSNSSEIECLLDICPSKILAVYCHRHDPCSGRSSSRLNEIPFINQLARYA
jgi:hypothetical protein